MDYDDNDAQSLILQLAGEGRSKSSSELRPYAFPKFDFDDSLQGHLRFDSLVESDVFLGIQSQDNQWIEDFSRGSNGIEFSSTATESCSISRRNNVWSEATFSESVDMLLKSVGQEEMLPGDTIVQESNNCDELGCLAKQMEPKLNQDDKKDEYVLDSNASLTQDEFLKNFPGLSVERELPQIEGTSHLQESMIPAHESRCLGPNVSVDECNTSLSEGNSVVDGEYADNNGGEAKFAVNDAKFPVGQSFDDKTGEDSPDHARHNFNSSVAALSTSENQELVGGLSYESTEGLIEAASTGPKRHNVSSQETQSEILILEQNMGEAAIHVVEGTSHFVSNADSTSSLDAVEISSDSFRESAGMSPKDKSQSQGKDGSYANLGNTGVVEVEDLSVSREITHSFQSSFHDNSPGDSVHQHAAESKSANAGKNASSGVQIDSVITAGVQDSVQLEDMPEIYCEKYGEVSVSTAEPSLFPSEDKKASTFKSDSISQSPGVESCDLAVFSSSVGLNSEKTETEGVKDLHAAFGVDVEKPGDTVDCLTSVDEGSRQAYDVASKQADVAKRKQDFSAVKEDSACRSELPPEVKNIHFEGAGTLQAGDKSIIDDEVVVHGLPPEMAAKSDSVDDVSSPGMGHVQGLIVSSTEGGHDKPSGASLSQLNAEEENAMKKSTFASSSRMEGSAQVAIEVDAACEIKVGETDYAAGALSSDMAGKSPPVKEISIAVSVNEPPVVPSNSSKPYSEKSDVHPNCDDPNLEVGDSAGAVGTGSHEEEIMKIECQNTSIQPADSHKAECDSPTIISSNEISQSDRGKQYDGRGSEVTNEFAKTIQSISEDPKGKDASGNDGSFTFKVDSLPDISDREDGRNWSPFHRAEMCNSPLVVEGSTPVEPGRTSSQQTPRICDLEMPSGTSKTTSERKGRRGSGKGTSKENPKKANHVKAATQDKPSRRGDKLSIIPLVPFGSSPQAKFAEMQSYGHIEQNNVKLSAAFTVPTSNLPDLNSLSLNNSAPPSAAFQQPFTDMQQVQLRAQIFVYGSLIQGTAPDEPCMVAAFGPSDGGRCVWEPVWRSAVERNKKSQPSAAETPRQSYSGPRVHDLTGVQGSYQSRVLPSPVARASSKAAAATILNPIIPLSSPIWTISTPSRDGLQPSSMVRGPNVDSQQASSPMRPYQTTLGRDLAGQTSWPSQDPFRGPWIATPQTSAADASAHISTVSITETVKLTSLKSSSGPSPSSLKLVTSSPVVHSGGPTTLFAASSLQHDIVKGMVSPQLHSANPKPPKRKKVAAPGDPGHITVLSQALPEPVVASSVMTPISALAAIPTPVCLPSRIDLSQSTGNVVPACSADQLEPVDLDTGKSHACSEEILSKVAEAKIQAEEAAANAAMAVGYSQSIWTQLAKQKEAGFTSEAEAKLASAAVAIAAAASVAKAAAVAAKIASDAALQAKLMADEVFLSSKTNDYTLNSGIAFKDVQSMGKATPASILRGDGGTNESSSILLAAKEAAKRRIDAASAASKQAENLDAIVKAAELAAEAVSQAGKIVAMGDPLPLSELIAAGPEGYWKLPQASTEFAVKLDENGKPTAGKNVEVVAHMSVKVSGNGVLDERCGKMMNHGGTSPHRVMSIGSLDDNTRMVDGNKPSTSIDEQNSRRHKSDKAFEMTKPSEVLSEPETGSRTGISKSKGDEPAKALHENSIKEGSLVEVSKNGGGLKPGWFSAKVLSLEDGKAFVSYDDLLSEDGSGNLKEWLSVEDEEDHAPRIRIAHPLSSLQFKGPRKRHRTAMRDFAWTVGDRVDAFIQDCWCEGVLTEKSEKEETTFTVHFPARGESSVVRAWQLRPSQIWNGENWVEWSSSGERNYSHQGDTPQEKRQKLEKPTLVPGEKLSEDVDPRLGKPEQSKLLALSAGDKVFNVGRSTREEYRPGAQRASRTGSQRESSRVVFGVPKPGKKRKFMEVSKHYPADRSSKNNDGNNDSVKFAKYLMPKSTLSRGWRNASKLDSKEKQTAEVKAKVPGPRRPPSVSNRTITQRNNFPNSSLAVGDDTAADQGTEIEDSVDRENTSEKSSLMEHVSSSGTEEASEGPLSSLFGQQLDGLSKQISMSVNKSERLGKRRAAPSGGKLTKIEEDKVYNGNSGKSVPELVEPRRSNRRIQPTHRLLEGLQSALIISKMPSISHDKGHKSHNRSSSSRGK